MQWVAEIPQLNCVTSPDNAICDGEYTYMYTCHYIQRLAQINLVPGSLVEGTSLG